MNHDLQYIVWQEGKHFVAQCLNVEVSSFGNSRDEAISNLEEALDLYFEDSGPDVQIRQVEVISRSLKHA